MQIESTDRRKEKRDAATVAPGRGDRSTYNETAAAYSRGPSAVIGKRRVGAARSLVGVLPKLLLLIRPSRSHYNVITTQRVSGEPFKPRLLLLLFPKICK